MTNVNPKLCLRDFAAPCVVEDDEAEDLQSQ